MFSGFRQCFVLCIPFVSQVSFGARRHCLPLRANSDQRVSELVDRYLSEQALNQEKLFDWTGGTRGGRAGRYCISGQNITGAARNVDVASKIADDRHARSGTLLFDIRFRKEMNLIQVLRILFELD